MEIHLTPLEIEGFIEGHLDRSERVLEHLDYCRLCVRWLADGVSEKQQGLVDRHRAREWARDLPRKSGQLARLGSSFL